VTKNVEEVTEDGEVDTMRCFIIYMLQQMTAGQPNKRIRRRQETKHTNSENMHHKSEVVSCSMYLHAAISQVEMVRKKSEMVNSKLNFVLASDTFQCSTLYLTPEQCSYCA
jgi:hypothetical protein